VNLYLDTSALIKRYIDEMGSPDVRAWIRSSDDKATTLITRAEISAAINRLLRMRQLSQEDYGNVLEEFRSEWQDFHRLPITEMLVARADNLACEHNLRGYDSVHLAAALIWQELLGLPVTLATFDGELAEAARASSMMVLP
jgi:uncharacterized protein